jgi:hypothetical protein
VEIPGKSEAETEVNLQKTLDRVRLILHFEFRKIQLLVCACQKTLAIELVENKAVDVRPGGGVDWRLSGRLHEEVRDESQRYLFSHA